MDIITTIGPKSNSVKTLRSLNECGANYFRINLSHSNEKILGEYIHLIESAGLKVSLDTQGAQIRLGEVDGIIDLSIGDKVNFCGSHKTLNEKYSFKINHSEVFNQIKCGCKLRIDFDGAIVLIEKVDSELQQASGTVISQGTIRSNRAIDIVNSSVKLNALTDFDKSSISAYASRSEALFISFTNSRDDIHEVKKILNNSIDSKSKLPKIIAKIESKTGIHNLEEILPIVDGILIDRGDLSREISISYIPIATKSIVQLCNIYNKPCFVATNILDSMMTASLPSRAEVSDIYNLISNGVSGLVLASEVAIGSNPIDSVRVLRHMYNVYRNSLNSTLSIIPSNTELPQLPTHLAEWL